MPGWLPPPIQSSMSIQSVPNAYVPGSRLPPVAKAFLEAREIWQENKRLICDLNPNHDAELCTKCGPNEAQKLVQTWLEECGVLEREVTPEIYEEPEEWDETPSNPTTEEVNNSTQDLTKKRGARVKKVVQWLSNTNLRRRHTVDVVEGSSQASESLESISSSLSDDSRQSRPRFRPDFNLKCPPPNFTRRRDKSPLRSPGTRDFPIFADLTAPPRRPRAPLRQSSYPGPAMESIEEQDFLSNLRKYPELFNTRRVIPSAPLSHPVVAPSFTEPLSRKHVSKDVQELMHQWNVKRSWKDDWLLFILYYWVMLTAAVICISPYFMVTLGLRWCVDGLV